MMLIYSTLKCYKHFSLFLHFSFIGLTLPGSWTYKSMPKVRRLSGELKPMGRALIIITYGTEVRYFMTGDQESKLESLNT